MRRGPHFAVAVTRPRASAQPTNKLSLPSRHVSGMFSVSLDITPPSAAAHSAASIISELI